MIPKMFIVGIKLIRNENGYYLFNFCPNNYFWNNFRKIRTMFFHKEHNSFMRDEMGCRLQSRTSGLGVRHVESLKMNVT